MNLETANRLFASVYRQLFLMKMLSYEYEFFLKFPLPSGVKNILFRGKNSFQNCVNELQRNMPKSTLVIQKTVIHSDEKIRAISTILEKLAVLDESEVLALEEEFDKQVKVKY